MNKLKKHVLIYALVPLMALVFLLLFSTSTSPLSLSAGYDSAFFKLVGKGMLNGKMPYKDFFDMKGPYLFLVECIGQVVCYGRVGIFIVQCVNLSISLIIVCKIYELFNINNVIQELALLIPCFWLLSVSFEGGNLTEEFSLLPLLLCLYFSLKYYKNCKEEGIYKHNPKWAFLYGICFGFIALIRITNTALICSIILCICVVLIVNKEYKNLWNNAVGFIGGVILIALPVIIYFFKAGMLNEMLYTVFVFGYQYSAEKGLIDHIKEFNERKEFYSFFLAAPIISIFYTKDWKMILFALMASISTICALITGNNYLHYYTLVLPLIIIAEVEIREVYKRRLSLNLLIMFFVIASVYPMCNNVKHSIGRSYKLCFDHKSFKENLYAIDIVKQIPESDRDLIFSYEVPLNWYEYTNTFPCIKYCGWQNHYVELDPSIEYDLRDELIETSPKWIILPAEDIEIPPLIKEEFDKYDCVYTNQAYRLLHY